LTTRIMTPTDIAAPFMRGGDNPAACLRAGVRWLPFT